MTCGECALGQLSNADQTACEACAIGMFGRSQGICEACPIGWYQDGQGKSNCKIPPPGNVANIEDGRGSTTFNKPAYLVPSSCKDDEYLDDSDEDKMAHSCVRCGTGAYCKGPITLGGIRPLFGWWRIPEEERSAADNSSASVAFAQCIYPPACLGVPDALLASRFPTDFSLEQQEAYLDNQGTGNSSCNFNLGFLNNSRLCTQCRDGFARRSGSLCVACEGGAGGALPLLVIGLLVLIFGFVTLIALRLKSFGSGRKYDSARRRKAPHSTLKRIILSHVQTLSLILGLAVPWPTLMTNALAIVSAVSTFSDNANAVECTIQGVKDHAAFYYGLLVLAAFLPLGLIALLALHWYIIVPRCGTKLLSCGTRVKRGPLLLSSRRELPELYEPSTSDAFISSSVLLWFLILPSLVRIGVTVFKCEYVGKSAPDKTRYLAIDMQEACDIGAERHTANAIGLAVPMLWLYAVIVPALIMLRLQRVGGRARLDDPNLMLRWGLLYSGYANTKYWWELAVLFRKYCIIMASTFIALDTNQLHVVLGVLVLALHLHDVYRPFGLDAEGKGERTLLHRFEMMSLVVLIFCVWCGVYFSVSSDLCATQEGWCTFMVVLILALNAGYLIALAGKCCVSWCERNHVKNLVTGGLKRASAGMERMRKGGGIGGAEKKTAADDDDDDDDEDAPGDASLRIEPGSSVLFPMTESWRGNPMREGKHSQGTRGGDSGDSGGGANLEMVAVRD
jgi:hypothetical protein